MKYGAVRKFSQIIPFRGFLFHDSNGFRVIFMCKGIRHPSCILTRRSLLIHVRLRRPSCLACGTMIVSKKGEGRIRAKYGVILLLWINDYRLYSA